MSLRKFRPKDIITNTMKAHPSCEFLVADGQIYYNNTPAQSGAISANVPISPGHISLYEMNVDRISGSTGRFIGGSAETNVILSDSATDYSIINTTYGFWAGPGMASPGFSQYEYKATSAAATVVWLKMKTATQVNFGTGSFDFASPADDNKPDGSSLSPSNKYLSAKSLLFDGVDDYLETDDDDALSFGASPLTFAAWVRPIVREEGDTAYTMKYPFILHKGADSGTDLEYFFGLQDADFDGKYALRCRLGDTANSAYIGRIAGENDTNMVTNTWYHVAATWDGTAGASTGIKLYVNGEEVSTTDESNDASSFVSMVNGGEKLYVGSRAGGDSHHFKGNMTQLSMWNTILGANEIQALYQASITPTYEMRGGYVPSDIVDNRLIYPFVTKDGTRVSLSTVYTGSTYETDFAYGNVVSASYPLSSSITRELMGWYPKDEGADVTFLSTNAPSLYPTDGSGGSRGSGQLVTGNPCLSSRMGDDFWFDAGYDVTTTEGCAAVKTQLEAVAAAAAYYDIATDCKANNTLSTNSAESGYVAQADRWISCNAPRWPHYWAMKNLFDNYAYKSEHYKLSSSYGYKDMQMINLISIPSIFYGSQIKPGSVSLRWYLSGTLIGELQDTQQNGVLYQISGSPNPYISQWGPGNGVHGATLTKPEPAGIVFYNEGFIALTGSWYLNHDSGSQLTMRSGSGNTFYPPTWLDWGAGANDNTTKVTTSNSGGYGPVSPLPVSASNNFQSASFGLSFKGTSETQVITMFANARRGEANYSNNPTYLVHKVDATGSLLTSSNAYIEDTSRLAVNFVSSSFPQYSASFKRQVYISRVGIYDENKNLIGVATMSNPVRKAEDEDLTFKLKLDI